LGAVLDKEAAMKDLGIWMIFVCIGQLFFAGCEKGNPGSLSGDGESCNRTADCEGDLSCIDHKCVSGGEGDTDSDAGPPEDRSDLIYDPTTVIEVIVEMDPVDWEDVRTDQRDLSCIEGGGCQGEPCYSTYIWKSATVTVNGEVVENAGIRKKGMLGSVNSEKPGLKIKFNKFVEDQFPFGMERLTLNNNVSDLSFLRQCLAYEIFRQAGSPAPRCNFATVQVNGSRLGLYTNLEPIKKRFLARHFESNDGDLYESSWIADFRDDWTGSYEPKTTETDVEQTRILALAKSLEKPDEELVAALTPLVDLQAFATFWALESLLTHGDGYTNEGNNSYFYFEPKSGKMYGIPWGMDKSFIPAEYMMPPVFTKTILPNRLYGLSEGKALFFDALTRILTDVWDVAELTAEIDRIEELLAPHAAADPWYATAVDWSGNPAEFAPQVDALRNYLSVKRSQMEETIATPPTELEKLAQCGDDGGKP
jgi:CotH kinase protein